MAIYSALSPSTHVDIIRDFLMKERSRCLRELQHMPRYMEQQVCRIRDNALDESASAGRAMRRRHTPPKRQLRMEA